MLNKALPIFLVIIAILVYILLSFRYAIDKQNVSYILDKFVLALESEIKNEKIDALKMAISLSKNSALVDALENEDEDLGYKILSGITQEIKNYTQKDIKVQILTHDYHIFARSWDDVYTGMPLEDFRSDLQYFSFYNTPRSSIETGRMLSIKTTVPVYRDETLLGFVEIISFFDSITSFFKKIGVDLYVLMDDKYYDIAVFMQNNETVDRYIMANRNYNHNNIDLLRKIDFQELKVNKALALDDNYIFCENIKNGNSESIGLFVFVLTKRYLEYFKEENDETSFFINFTKKALYDVVRDEQKDLRVKEFEDIKSLMTMKDEMPVNMQNEYIKLGYEKLNEYTKEELIELVLEQKIIKKVDGKIK
ncbi:cache domain-containing protein [Sulfurimonas sp.]|uniref:cache domain-containing protein n=1 Tax=Sulfurimonas sp. TaxID=2022749 RepID=UPI0019DABFB6|nr:cache domain-containing protein [Sulfurimonas sp.]MBE0514231.1 hypothetical protein [Sulfurimonas sp.]